MLALAPTLVLGGLACKDDAAIEPSVDSWGKRSDGHCRSRARNKATQGSAVVVTDDARYAVATNRTAGRVTIFSLALGSAVPATRLAEIDVGKDSQPWAAVIGDDDRTAYVILRKAQQLVRIGVRGTNMVDLAQGGSGFNIPSLLNMVVGAPYFHAGNARTLEESLGDVFAAHRTALATSFAPDQRQLRQLVAFLLSIDEDTKPVKSRLAEDFDLCAQFPPGAIQ